MKNEKTETKIKKKKQYEIPKVISEKIYEINALKCGKCASGPFHQYACVRLRSIS